MELSFKNKGLVMIRSQRNTLEESLLIKSVFPPVVSSAISGLDGDGRAGPVWGEEQCGRPPLHQTAVLLQEGHTGLSWRVGGGQCDGYLRLMIHLQGKGQNVRSQTGSEHKLFMVLQGKGMLLVLQDRMLTLVDPEDRSLLHSQPISSIRVWGVGRDHDR